VKYLRLIIAPLCILVFFVAVGFLWKLLDLPPQEQLIPIIQSYFDTYGILLVFISSIIESAFIIGVYAPGGLVIFLGVIFSAGDPVRAALVVGSVMIAFLIGFTIDFYIGRYGWYKFFTRFGFGSVLEKTKQRIQKYGISIPWLMYHNPDTGSFVATAYGILQYKYRQFLLISILPVIVWCAIWGSVAYVLGMNALNVMGYKTLIFILLVWIIARIIEVKLQERNKVHT
jgi:membrane protein DedA with SNARE-associated domain